MDKNKKHESGKIDKESVIPIYYQLAKILKDKIFSGEFKPEEKLPPENNIAGEYGISRMTVRRAIAELIDAGMVYAEKGSGTFVARPCLENVVFELKNFQEEIRERGLKPRTRLLEVKIVKSNQDLSERLQVPLNTRCLFFRLLISAEREPLIYENKYVVYKKQNPILEKELKDPSLSNLALLHADSMPIRSKRVLLASVTDKEESSILSVKLNTPVFVIEQTLYDTDKKTVGWGKSICRGDRFKLSSDVGWPFD